MVSEWGVCEFAEEWGPVHRSDADAAGASQLHQHNTKQHTRRGHAAEKLQLKTH